MLLSRKSRSLTLPFHWALSKSWSQIQKVGVKYSKFEVSEISHYHWLLSFDYMQHM